MKHLLQFIEYQNITIHKFEQMLGFRGVIVRSIKLETNIGSNVIAKIFETFPEINPAWLLTGRGEMLQGVAEKKEVPSDKLADKIEIIKLQRSEIARLEKDLQQCLDKKKFIADRQPNV